MVIKNVISKYHTKPDISLRVGKKYRVFFILGSICTVILSILIPINLLLAFIAYTSGNEEWCSPTGRELQEGPDVMDHWLEYEDSEGELHYGR